MGKKGKKAQAGKPKKLTPKEIGKRLDALVRKLGEELKGADLFAPLPPTEDCPICCIPLSRIRDKSTLWACCGNSICNGCKGEGHVFLKKESDICPFCRTQCPSTQEWVRQIEAKASQNDAFVMCELGGIFGRGKYGVPKDELRALDCYIRAAELGSASACSQIGRHYEFGNGDNKDMGRSAFFYRAGALRDSIVARHDLGCWEYNAGNYEIGIRHWKIAAEAGSQISLNQLKRIFNAGGKVYGKECISKGDMDKIYRACHMAQEEVNSEEREKHSRFEDEWKC